MRRVRQTRAATTKPALRAGIVALALSAGLAPHTPTLAQQSNPVYVDDSLAAAEAISRAIEVAASGNHAEASRVLQRVLDEDAERLIADPDDPNLFHTVRRRVHEVLLARPALLEEYRAVESVEAARLFAAGRAALDERAERTRLLTEPGLDAALRVAQRRIERAQFWSALRVLEQLPAHPDLDAQRRARAVALAKRASEYLSADPAAIAIAESIAQSRGGTTGGVALDISPRELPPTPEGRSPFDEASEAPFDSMISKPLWSAPIINDLDAIDAVRNAAPTSGDLPRVAALSLSVMPAATEDTVFVNSGDLIAAFDRYTLAPRWPQRRFEPSGFNPASRVASRRPTARGISVDDTSSVVVEGPWLIAVTGTPTGNRRLGDGRVHAIDTQTGETAWAVDVGSLDPNLDASIVRGKPIVHAGVVVLTVSRQLAQRRLEGIQFVGLDLATGALLWRTPLASAGALPYNAANSSADNSVEWRGLAIRSDELGAIGAVDIASGRPLWVRRSPNASLARRESWPYEAHAPVVIDSRLFSVGANAARIVELDATTGVLLAEYETTAIGAPRYLVSVDDRLFSVGETSVVALDIPDADEPRNPQLAGKVVFNESKPGIRGRVVPAQEALVVPVRDGVAIVRLSSLDPTGRPRIQRLELDRPGVVLPMRDQLIVVDDVEIHTYLLWETAERQLLRRIESEPTDPTPAVVYAELAYRAEKPQTILPAVRLAQRSLDRDPASPISRASRQRLFASIVGMLKPETPSDATPLSREVRTGLVDALDALAGRPDERATALLLRGEHAQTFSGPESAVAAYQTVLDEPALASAQLRGMGVMRSASDEATRRLRSIVRERGAAIYARYDAEAQGALARLGLWSDANAYEDLARRYPVAPTSARVWLAAAEAHDRAGRPERAALALENGLTVARDALAEDPELLGELAGRLVVTLQRLGRPAAATQALARLLSEHGEIPLSVSGEPLELASLRASLASAASEAGRLPRVGPINEDAEPTPFVEWSIAEPLVQRDVPGARSHIVLAGDGRYALVGLNEQGVLGVRWELPRAGTDALVRLDDRAAYFSGDTNQGRTVARIDAATGEQAWVTPPFRSIFDADAATQDPRLLQPADQRSPPFIDVPAIGRRQILELLVAFDERTFAIVERSGRAAAFDLQSGILLWARNDLPAEVYDIATDAGVLIVGGAHTARRIGDTNRIPAVLALDLRSGRTIHEARPDAGPVRWIRAAGPGRTIVGFENGVACFDPFRGEQRWYNSSPALRDSVESWVFDDRVIVMDQTDRLWQVRLDDGALRPEPLDTESRIARGGTIRVANVEGRAAFASLVGLVVYGPDGSVVGKDAALNSDSLIQSTFVDRHLVTIEQNESERRADLNAHKVRIFDSRTGALRSTQRVLLGARPLAIGAIDGHVFITAGQITIAYPAPPTTE
jgi:outer membrane protein assembly factor BamB/tetratricopeptide (TPR) repeat protein